ncbi:hypothetical protein [Rheinheimera sp. EpRS3]|uniref:hypothetical protein n=1 Tax=Rheinheimera sp. EpRS3 TaxID=1712383 RepID=UPI0007481F6C|nr:hypothetical protein [Rheinheimera sp. EpRS3]KUM52531.1 hypothetical protein AR688_09540 [Rheinheimera sp. EpRS3]
MSQINTASNTVAARSITPGVVDTPGGGSAVSWAAIFAGAVGAAALSLLLVILGTGLGFSAVSPWRMEGFSVATLGFAAIAWLSFTQLAASGIGGYLAGRLRTKWTAVHTDEVYFRDTAHGFLTWAVASLLTVIVLTSVAGTLVSSGVKAGAAVAGAAATTVAASATTMAAGETSSGEGSNTIEYFVDSLFRADANSLQRSEQSADAMQIPAGEVMRIVMQALRSGTLPQQDERYIAELIAQRTSISQQDAQQRVSEGFTQVQTTLKEAETATREAADTARKASAYAALWMFIALLIGAFTASLMAVFGGRQRDA